MTDTTARRLADGILVAAALGAAYYVATTPRLRRMAAGLAATMVTSTLPAWLSAEVRRAWAESERSTFAKAPVERPPTFDEAPAGRPISATAPLGKAI